MARPFRLSGAIDTRPERFDVDELVRHAEELLRESKSKASSDPINSGVIEFYIERGLVDTPKFDGETPYFVRRHLLQLMAVQVLRGLDLGLEEIGTLVREVDDKNLKLLVDEPEEAEKKANVMRNWLNVIARGRYNEGDQQREITYTGGSRRRATIPPPMIQPSRAPLVPAEAREGRAKRTLLGNPNGPLPGTGSIPSDLPEIGTFAPAGAAAGRGPRRPVHSRAQPAERAERSDPPPRGRRRSRGITGPIRLGAITWTRHTLSLGIELHVAEGFDDQGLPPDEVYQILERVRRLLEGE